MFQSEIFEVLDALYYDEAIDGHKNANYTISSSGSVSTDATGTTVTIGTQYHSYRLMKDSDNRLTVTAPFVWEFDVLETTNMRVNIYQSDSVSKQINLNNTGHYKFIVADNKVTYSIDDGTPTETTFNYTDVIQLWIQSRNANATSKFKNLKVYPI